MTDDKMAQEFAEYVYEQLLQRGIDPATITITEVDLTEEGDLIIHYEEKE